MGYTAYECMTIEEMLARVKKYDGEGAGCALVERAYHFAEKAHEGQFRKSGEPYIVHPTYVASILAELMIDPPTIAAALLHDTLEDCEEVTMQVLEEEFGEEVTRLVDGVTKLSRLEFADREEQQAESLHFPRGQPNFAGCDRTEVIPDLLCGFSHEHGVSPRIPGIRRLIICVGDRHHHGQMTQLPGVHIRHDLAGDFRPVKNTSKNSFSSVGFPESCRLDEPRSQGRVQHVSVKASSCAGESGNNPSCSADRLPLVVGLKRIDHGDNVRTAVFPELFQRGVHLVFPDGQQNKIIAVFLF